MQKFGYAVVSIEGYNTINELGAVHVYLQLQGFFLRNTIHEHVSQTNSNIYCASMVINK